MKLLVASILTMSVFACVAPADTQPEPEAALPSQASAAADVTSAAAGTEANAAAEHDASAAAEHDTNAGDPFRVLFFCVNNVGPSCVAFPASFPNAHADCIKFCQLDGTPNPICRITLADRVEC